MEALDSLNAYTQASPDVRRLIGLVQADQRHHLGTARRVLKEVGRKVLAQVRDHTFHVPSPKPNYDPTSDEQLQAVLSRMGSQPCDLHLDHRGEHAAMTLSFAGDVALALALARSSADDETAHRHFEQITTGAVAFTKWAEALLIAYLDSIGGGFGEPEIISSGT